jgi:hypothetical protein
MEHKFVLFQKIEVWISGLSVKDYDQWFICKCNNKFTRICNSLSYQRPPPRGSLIWSIKMCHFERLRYGSQDFQFKNYDWC